MRLSITFLFILLGSLLYSQSNNELDYEFQLYPTGIITGLRFEKAIPNNATIHAKLGVNIFDHRDLGVHDGEEGSGFGFDLGYKRFFNESRTKWSLGVKTGVWFNEVDWFDVGPTDERITGTTDIVVIQPTLEAGYTFLFRQSFVLTPTLAFGLEWNVKTTGEPTGEGPILLVGILAGKRF